MADDLQHWLRKKPVSAMQGGKLYGMRCFLKRHWLASAAAAAVVSVALIGGLAVALYGLHQAEQARDVAEAQKLAAITAKKDSDIARAEGVHTLGLALAEKADRAFSEQRFNEGQIYAAHALARLDVARASALIATLRGG